MRGPNPDSSFNPGQQQLLDACTHPPVSVWEIKAHRGEPYADSLQVLTSHWCQASQGLCSSSQEPLPCHTHHPIICPSAWAGCTLQWPPSLSLNRTQELSVQERARAIATVLGLQLCSQREAVLWSMEQARGML